jgi:hypothetical protein
LRAYNQDKGRSSERLRRDGILSPGDVVVVPQLKPLMDKYESLIRPLEPEKKPAATSGTTSSFSPPVAPTPAPLPTVSGSGQAAPIQSASTTAPVPPPSAPPVAPLPDVGVPPPPPPASVPPR